MKLKGKVGLRFSDEGIIISIEDEEARVNFVEAIVPIENCMRLLGGHYRVDCELDVGGLQSVGKKMEHKQYIVMLPETATYKDRKELAKAAIEAELAGTEWVSDNYFGSQRSFFVGTNGRQYAQTTVRRWI